MSKLSYFMELSHFGATGRHCGEDHFFSPAQYLVESKIVSSYRPGGSPPYGMQRRMLDEYKKPDRVLNPRQRKGLQNGRTILQKIFLLFVEQGYSEKQIAGHLNDPVD